MYINQVIYNSKPVALSPLWKQKMQRVKITIIQYVATAHSRHKTLSGYYVTVKLSESKQITVICFKEMIIHYSFISEIKPNITLKF